MLKHIALTILLCALPAAAAEDYATQMTQATVKIFNRSSTAAGFFVRPSGCDQCSDKPLLLVTAGHVFEKMTGEQATIVFRKLQPDGTFVRQDHPVKIRDGTKPLWTQHSKYDIAVLAMEIPPGMSLTPIELDSLADETALKESGMHIGSDLLILGYPFRIEANGAGFPIARHGSIAGYPLWPVQTNVYLMVDFTTFAGDSGGPVFIADPRQKEKGEHARPLVLGIVIAQIREDEKINSIYEEETVHHPINVSKVIQAAFVRETIELVRH